jgi:D-sedoheptulose 7-phosphate isomerase
VHQWIVPGQTSDRIQEIHMLILHILVEAIEVELGVA